MKILLSILLIFLSIQSFANSQYKMCRINIEKVAKTDSVTKSYKAGKKLRANHSNKNSSSSEISSLVMIQGRTSSMEIDGTTVVFKCYISGPKQYNIDVILNSEKSGISTSVFVTPGQKIDLGGVVKDLKDKEKSLNIKDGISYETTEGKSSVKYYLYSN